MKIWKFEKNKRLEILKSNGDSYFIKVAINHPELGGDGVCGMWIKSKWINSNSESSSWCDIWFPKMEWNFNGWDFETKKKIIINPIHFKNAGYDIVED